MSLPDLTTYAPHRSTGNADFEGTAVPGLRADFYRRTDGDRIASVGCYSYAGQDVLMAWGYVDERHCRRHAVHDPAGGWQAVVDGCPDVRFVRDGDGPEAPVLGFEVRGPDGGWLRTAPAPDPPGTDSHRAPDARSNDGHRGPDAPNGGSGRAPDAPSGDGGRVPVTRLVAGAVSGPE